MWKTILGMIPRILTMIIVRENSEVFIIYPDYWMIIGYHRYIYIYIHVYIYGYINIIGEWQHPLGKYSNCSKSRRFFWVKLEVFHHSMDWSSNIKVIKGSKCVQNLNIDITSISPDISTTNCNSRGSTQVSWLYGQSWTAKNDKFWAGERR